MRAPYEHSPLVRRPPLGLPDGARVAVWLGLNVEHYPAGTPGPSIEELTSRLVPDPLNQGWRDYGPRVGLWRTVEVLERHGAAPSILLNSDVCTAYPEVVEEGRARGWCWVAHGRDNTVLQQTLELDDERTYLREVAETIESAVGRRPRGWLGPALSESEHTLELLAELGFDYVCDWCADDQPVPLRVEGRRMINVPYSIELNDIPFFLRRGGSAADFERALIDHFEVLNESGSKSGGAVMAIALHGFLIGQPHRLLALDRALEHIAGHEGAWLTTSDEIADWYLAEVPA